MPRTSLTGRFAKALDADGGPAPDPDLLPARLARAAAAALPVDGVGLSIHGGPDLRTPLAASSEIASLAESLQFTAGRGPCQLAAESGYPIFATEELLARRWPIYHQQLLSQTRIRSVLALSLPGRLRGVGGMTLLFTEPYGAAAIDIFEARHVARLVSDHLGPAADWSEWAPGEPSPGLDTPDARRRGRLWMAVGMIMLTLRVTAQDALALLRAHAYAAGRTADDLAQDLVQRRTHPQELREQSDDGP